MTTTQTPTTTARKTTVKGKIVVEVTLENGEIVTFGGKRAERAEAVVMRTFNENETPGAFGLRATFHSAQNEATRLLNKDGQNAKILTPCKRAYAIRITD